MSVLIKNVWDTLKKITVEPVAFAYLLTIYCEYTALQDMIFLKECMTHLNVTDTSLCSKESISSHADIRSQISGLQAIQTKYYMGIFSLFAVMASLFTGSWSDIFGRKPLMMLPSALGIPAEILFIFSSIYVTQIDIRILVYLAAIFNGLSGGTTTIVASCFGYMTDITSFENRSKRVTVLESFLFVGGFFGYNLAGILIRHYIKNSYEYIFALCTLFHIIILIYVYFLDETRGPKRKCRPLEEEEDENGIQVQSPEQKLFSLKHVKGMFWSIFKFRQENNYRKKLIFLCICCIISSFGSVIQVILTFSFVKNPQTLNWDSSTYSLYSGLNFLLSGMSLILILPVTYHFWPSFPDTFVCLLGLASKGAGLLNFGLSTTTTHAFISIILYMFSEYTMPSLRSIISKLVDEDEKGKAFSFLGSLSNLVQLMGSFILPTIFTQVVHWFPGLPFVIVAALQLIGCILLLYVNVLSICDK